MSVFKRKNQKNWSIKFEHCGVRVYQSAGTTDKTEAEQKEAQLKHQIWLEQKLGEQPQRSWNEAVVKYISEKQHKKSIADDIIIFRQLDPFLSNTNLHDLTRTIIDDILETIQTQRGISNARTNRLAAVIRGLLNMACKQWEWIDKSPSVRMRKEANIRIRWITHTEAFRLIQYSPKHLKNVIKLALATGLRKSNLLGLKWSQLDMQRKTAWVYGDEAKGKKDFAIPLNQEAIATLRNQIGIHQEYVFAFNGKPIKFINYHTWRAILSKAGIENFRFHDLRHTWASWHVQSGTSLQELMELGAWSDFSMVLRYAHLSSDRLKDAAENIVAKSLHKNVIELQR